jgi:hypothetical protein
MKLTARARILVVAQALLATLVSSASAQEEPVDPCAGLVRAWVDPRFGTDPAYALPVSPGADIALIGQINDPNAPYKSLQAAIDAVHAQLGVQWTAGSATQGVVYALPGLYGQHGTDSSGDAFPIQMRDRVHVRGLGARRCTIRGTGTFQTPPLNVRPIFWPDGAGQPNQPPLPATFNAEILVDYGSSGLANPGFWVGGSGVPWLSMGDSAELLDGFTLQGGDVQVLVSSRVAGSPESLSGTITNCVFDMRDSWQLTPADPALVSGPWFGVMLVKNLRLSGTILAYREQKFLIANNTFVLAEFFGDGDPNGVLSRDVAVGVIDVTNTCVGFICENNGEQRGLGSPCLANNLFRLPPFPNDRRRALMGIEDSDVRIDDGTGNFVPSNAFPNTDLARCTSNFNVAALNRGFYSRPVRPMTLLDGGVSVIIDCSGGSCTPVAAPTQAVVIWDGSSGPGQVDPGFVGEFLESFLSPPGTTLPRVADWRLLPDSALKNRGMISNPPGVVAPTPMFVAQNGFAREDSLCPELASYQWDGESYGNPRIVDGRVDIGFDEIDSFIVCGTWGNHSNSHNAPPPLLQPTAQQGRAQRMFIFDSEFANRPCLLHGSGAVPANPPPAWFRPPETLATPMTNPAAPPGLPAERKTKYIRFTDTGTTPTGPAGWSVPGGTMGAVSFSPPPLLKPPGTPQFRSFTQAIHIVDDDLGGPVPPPSGPALPNLYFGMQAILTRIDGTIWWSNLQSEFR